MARTQPDLSTVAAVVQELESGLEPGRDQLKLAVRGLLARLAEQHPGRSVEVRVPPFGAVQCVAGPRHTRGTPPNVVEADPAAWVLLAAGRLDWDEAVSTGRVRASGVRSELSTVFPLWRE